MEAVMTHDLEPGGSLPLKVSVTDRVTGELVSLNGATVEANVTSGTFVETLDLVVIDEFHRQAVVGAATSLALRGRSATFRAFITPAASVETTVAKARINVAP